MTQQTDIKRLADGSIDYAHYIAISDAIRRGDRQQARMKIMQLGRKTGIAFKTHLLAHIVTGYSKTSPTSR